MKFQKITGEFQKIWLIFPKISENHYQISESKNGRKTPNP